VLGWTALAVFSRAARAQPTDTSAVLEAAAERILPGAREAKVGRFIERQLATDLAELRPAFEQLARLLDGWSRPKTFLALGAEEQDALLDRLSRGRFPQDALFRALHTITLEGVLSDPAHGGNDGQAGWKSIGFPEPHLRHRHGR
jgi:gluconate 2-dehydrogenase gamma chain